MRFVRYLILGIIFFYLQILIAPRMTVWETTPFYLTAFVIFIAMNLDLAKAAIIVFIVSLGLDLLNPTMLGTNILLLLLLTVLVSSYHTMIKKDRPLPVIISIFLLNLTYMIPYSVIRALIFGYEEMWLRLFISQLIYNTLITVLLLAFLLVGQKLRVVIS